MESLFLFVNVLINGKIKNIKLIYTFDAFTIFKKFLTIVEKLKWLHTESIFNFQFVLLSKYFNSKTKPKLYIYLSSINMKSITITCSSITCIHKN
jgi:hypothetical protein